MLNFMEFLQGSTITYSIHDFQRVVTTENVTNGKNANKKHLR